MPNIWEPGMRLTWPEPQQADSAPSQPATPAGRSWRPQSFEPIPHRRTRARAAVDRWKPDVQLVDDFGNPMGAVSLNVAQGVDTGLPLLHLAWTCLVTDGTSQVLAVRRYASGSEQLWTVTDRGHAVPEEEVTSTIGRTLAADLGLILMELRAVLPTFRYSIESDGSVCNELCPVFLARVGGELTCSVNIVRAEWVTWSRLCDEILLARRPATLGTIQQIAALSEFGHHPLGWPTADPADLPPAMVHRGVSLNH